MDKEKQTKIRYRHLFVGVWLPGILAILALAFSSKFAPSEYRQGFEGWLGIFFELIVIVPIWGTFVMLLSAWLTSFFKSPIKAFYITLLLVFLTYLTGAIKFYYYPVVFIPLFGESGLLGFCVIFGYVFVFVNAVIFPIYFIIEIVKKIYYNKRIHMNGAPDAGEPQR